MSLVRNVIESAFSFSASTSSDCLESDINQSPDSWKQLTVAHNVSIVDFPRNPLENSGNIVMFTNIITPIAVSIGYAMFVTIVDDTEAVVLVKMVMLISRKKNTNKNNLGADERVMP